MWIWVIYAIVWILFGYFGYLIGKPKGRETAGALLGFFLGIIGIIIVAVLPKRKELEKH
jgi:hypothetical protein